MAAGVGNGVAIAGDVAISTAGEDVADGGWEVINGGGAAVGGGNVITGVGVSGAIQRYQ